MRSDEFWRVFFGLVDWLTGGKLKRSEVRGAGFRDQFGFT